MSLALMSSVFCDAEGVLGQLGDWIADYNRQAPHSALGMRSRSTTGR
jgi:hypothetical protein